jgi:hypothetical protein
LSLDLQRAARILEESTKRDTQGTQPVNRTTSEIAARAASANVSPNRKIHNGSHGKVSPQQNLGSRSRDRSVSTHDRSGSEADTALLGATMSMSPEPAGVTGAPNAKQTGKIDFSKLPSLSHDSARLNQFARPTASSVSTSAARAASQGAQKRSHASTTESSPPKVPPIQGNISYSRPLPELRTHHTASHHPQSSSPSHESHRGQSVPVATLPVTMPRHNWTSAHLTTSSLQTSPYSGRAGVDVNNLANAMVASSIASSRIMPRAASPSKKKAPPVPRRRSRSLHELESRHRPDNPPLKPLTTRPMKQTLRKLISETDDEETKRGRKHRLRKHPNVHHEGDRKRWRDKVTAKERKRYEGVWAANRGLLHQFEAFNLRSKGMTEEDLVLNVVVRDIWDRSRLPRDVLEEIWDLVAEEGDKFLTREQFVVGLWLVDQRLKGRKLPVKVSTSVWSSVRHYGVKVSSKPL